MVSIIPYYLNLSLGEELRSMIASSESLAILESMSSLLARLKRLAIVYSFSVLQKTRSVGRYLKESSENRVIVRRLNLEFGPVTSALDCNCWVLILDIRQLVRDSKARTFSCKLLSKRVSTEQVQSYKSPSV